MANNLDDRIGVLRLERKQPVYKAYRVTLDAIDDIAELLGATAVDVVTHKDGAKSREYRVHFTTEKEKYSLRIADGFYGGDYLVTVDDGGDPLWDIKTAQEIGLYFDIRK